MAVKENIAYLIIGFALVAYLKLPILGLAIIAVGLAIIYYKRESKQTAAVATVGGEEDEL